MNKRIVGFVLAAVVIVGIAISMDNLRHLVATRISVVVGTIIMMTIAWWPKNTGDKSEKVDSKTTGTVGIVK